MTDTHRPTEMPFELPDDDPPVPPLFDVPDDGPVPGTAGPVFDLPDDAPPPAAAEAETRTIAEQYVQKQVEHLGQDVPKQSVEEAIRQVTEVLDEVQTAKATAHKHEVLPAAADVPAIRELLITPDIDAYLSMLEAAIAPYEATAKAFAQHMDRLPVDTPAQLAALGQYSLVAKDREKVIEELFEPAIRKPRQYLDRVYGVKRRVLQWVKTGGETAARRYTARKRELEDLDRKAKLEADRRQREAQRQADEAAAAERRRLAQEAALAAQQGNPAGAADLIEQARAVEPVSVPVDLPPPSLATAAAVAGISERQGWVGTIADMKDALMAAARPDIYRELAQLLEAGELTVGSNTLTTTMIASKLRALAAELPLIPSSMFAANEGELKKRADADKDTLRWPGFTFTQTFTPVRRTNARAKATS
jgi:hypothetical protein